MVGTLPEKCEIALPASISSAARPWRKLEPKKAHGGEGIPTRNSKRERAKGRGKRGGKVAHHDAKLRLRLVVEEKWHGGGWRCEPESLTMVAERARGERER